MSERSIEVFISHLVEPPEFDADEEQLEKNFVTAFYESSKIEILDTIGDAEFKFVWLTLKEDVQHTTIKLQRIFSEQTLDKISDVYDFTFSEKISLETQYELDDFYNFLEFFEFKNAKFLTFVWSYLGPKNLVEIDIEKYCKSNSDKIIKEIDEQLEIHPQSKLIALFLRTYYKEKIIDWIIKNSEQLKIEITVSILEREG